MYRRHVLVEVDALPRQTTMRILAASFSCLSRPLPLRRALHLKVSVGVQPQNALAVTLKPRTPLSPNPFVSRSRRSLSSSDDKTKENKEELDKLLEGIEEIVDVDKSHLEAAIDRSKFTVEIPVKMPALGTGGTSKVVQWFFAPGDLIKREDVLCDIETPDFTFGMETDDEELAILGKILVETGVPVPDNEVICILMHEASEKAKAKQQDESQRDEKEEDKNKMHEASEKDEAKQQDESKGDEKEDMNKP
jgi:Biotin-requiring enzyme